MVVVFKESLLNVGWLGVLVVLVMVFMLKVFDCGGNSGKLLFLFDLWNLSMVFLGEMVVGGVVVFVV